MGGFDVDAGSSGVAVEDDMVVVGRRWSSLVIVGTSWVATLHGPTCDLNRRHSTELIDPIDDISSPRVKRRVSPLEVLGRRHFPLEDFRKTYEARNVKRQSNEPVLLERYSHFLLQLFLVRPRLRSPTQPNPPSPTTRSLQPRLIPQPSLKLLEPLGSLGTVLVRFRFRSLLRLDVFQEPAGARHVDFEDDQSGLVQGDDGKRRREDSRSKDPPGFFEFVFPDDYSQTTSISWPPSTKKTSRGIAPGTYNSLPSP